MFYHSIELLFNFNARNVLNALQNKTSIFTKLMFL